MDAKMWWAQLDMECDELTVSLNKKISQLKQYQMRVTKLEVDLAKARESQLEQSTEADSQQSQAKKTTTISKKMGAFFQSAIPKLGKKSNQP